MACKWIIAEDGYKWELTNEGKKDAHVAAKFAEGYYQKINYLKRVPEKWVRCVYVRQVKVNGNDI